MGPGIQIFPAIDKPHVSLAAETLASLGFFNLTNSMLTMFIVIIGLTVFFAYASTPTTRRYRRGRNSRHRPGRRMRPRRWSRCCLAWSRTPPANASVAGFSP